MTEKECRIDTAKLGKKKNIFRRYISKYTENSPYLPEM